MFYLEKLKGTNISIIQVYHLCISNLHFQSTVHLNDHKIPNFGCCSLICEILHIVANKNSFFSSSIHICNHMYAVLALAKLCSLQKRPSIISEN